MGIFVTGSNAIPAITISTNMAGRGTDIVLGGNPESMAREKAGFDTSTEGYKKALSEFRKLGGKAKDNFVFKGGDNLEKSRKNSGTQL